MHIIIINIHIVLIFKIDRVILYVLFILYFCVIILLLYNSLFIFIYSIFSKNHYYKYYCLYESY